jgi:peroxiredoxin
MKKYCLFFALMLTTNCLVTQAFKAKPQPVPERKVETLGIGSKAPDFRLPGVDGKYHGLREYAAAKVLVIVFTCNHCPTAQAYEARIKKIVVDYKSKGVQVVAISPNSPIALLPEELGYSDLDDDFESMKIRAKEGAYNFPYLYDGDTHGASVQYGPVATPHAFVFDAARKLTYTGRLDDTEKPGTTDAEDLRAAIDATLAGKTVADAVTKTFGCSVKWAWKTEWKEKVEQDWKNKPVALEDIDEAGVKTLVQNAGSGKLLLLNVWATWCGPCVLEYPTFLDIQRMYGARDFEFVSISADKPAAKPKVLKFLQSKHSNVRNYLFSDNIYKLIEAIDPKWNGALPYTVLIEPDGKIVYSVQGAIKPLALKKTIVEHPKMGRYF